MLSGVLYDIAVLHHTCCPSHQNSAQQAHRAHIIRGRSPVAALVEPSSTRSAHIPHNPEIVRNVKRTKHRQPYLNTDARFLEYSLPNYNYTELTPDTLLYSMDTTSPWLNSATATAAIIIRSVRRGSNRNDAAAVVVVIDVADAKLRQPNDRHIVTSLFPSLLPPSLSLSRALARSLRSANTLQHYCC